jgi:hypothetical protein
MAIVGELGKNGNCYHRFFVPSRKASSGLHQIEGAEIQFCPIPGGINLEAQEKSRRAPKADPSSKFNVLRSRL